jgi:hypothetical protein
VDHADSRAARCEAIFARLRVEGESPGRVAVLFCSTVFALVGIAFFAVWSLLSNITASVIIFFRFPMSIGDRVELTDEPRVAGVVHDITLFHVLLGADDGSVLTIPDNIAIQKIFRIERTDPGSGLELPPLFEGQPRSDGESDA